MKRFLFLCLMACSLQTSVFAADANPCVDGIYYVFNSTSRTATVSYYKYTNVGDYSGSVTIPATVTYSNLVYSVTSIGTSAFAYSSSLTAVTIPSSVEDINSKAFYGCSHLKEIEIPKKVTGIGQNAFEGCNALKSVTLSDSLKTIGSNAFDSCTSLDSIALPAALTSIASEAFNFCTSLIKITSLNPEPPTCNSTSFSYVDTDNCTLYVPEGSKDAYASAEVWKDFYNIVEIETTTDDDNSGDGSDVSGDNSGDGSDASGDDQGDNSGDATNISSVAADGQANASNYFTIDGKEVAAPAKGVNIVKFADGTTKKVLAK